MWVVAAEGGCISDGLVGPPVVFGMAYRWLGLGPSLMMPPVSPMPQLVAEGCGVRGWVCRLG